MSERPVTVWLTLAQVADRLQVSARTVRREIADGRLPAARVRGIMRIGSERGRAMHREATAQ